jgi:hypothetical protein
MRRSLFLYLFVFTLLLAVVIYTNGKRIADSKDEKITYLEDQLATAQGKVKSLASERNTEREFSLSTNEEALSYLENRGLNPSEVSEQVENELITRNRANADNDLVPFEGMEGHFRINKVKLLNHKWLLASFSDGSYWGDLFLTYEVNESGRIEVSTKEALLYPRN